MTTYKRRVSALTVSVLAAVLATSMPACSDGNDSGDGGTVPPGSPPCTDLPLKTSRAPRLLWSCQRQTFLTNLMTTNAPQWQQLVGIADRTDTTNQLYGDNGGFAALVYQITGDMKYATKGIDAQIKELSANTKFDFNYTRDEWAEAAVIFDWLQGAMTDAQRTQVENVLYGWYDQFVALDPKAPIRTNDTDQTTGNYFGIWFTALATEGGNSRATELMNNKFVGGMDSTGSDLTTLRNSVQKYLTEWATGGVWIEGAYYDVETLELLMEGVEGMRTATGMEHFPEFVAFNEQVVRSQMEQLSPDFKGAVKWGDMEEIRDPSLWRRYQTLGMYIGTLPDNSPLKPMATQFNNDLVAASKANNDPVYGSRYFYYFNPAGPVADWHTLPLSHYATGQQIVFAHDGWDKNDSLLLMYLRRPAMNIDHENNLFGDFQLWRKGDWALTRPLGYGGGSVEPLAANAMVTGGLDSMTERTIIDENAATDGSYVYFSGTTKGQRYAAPYYMPPATFLNEWTRSFLYLPTTTSHAGDTIIVYDRSDAVQPTNLDRYTMDDQARINGAAKLKQWVIHTPVSPTLSPGSATWTSGGSMAQLTTLAPAGATQSVVDEHTLNWPSMFPPDSEKHFYLSISPPGAQQWDTFLNVLQVSDAAVASAPVRIASTDNTMEGARVSRPGQSDAVALFSSTQGTRVHAANFMFTANVTSDGFDLYVGDLDPSKKWSASPGGDLAVDAGGFGHVHVTGTGAVGVTVNAQ